jgi:hypothetical protein
LIGDTFGEQVRSEAYPPMKLGDVGNFIKFVLLIAALGGAWVQINMKLDAQTRVLEQSVVRGERIERYLSSKDVNYWETVKRLE